MAFRARRHRSPVDIWPGFVDAISALLIIIIFLLMVFTLAQYFLSELLSGRDEALSRLNRQVQELSELLELEKDTNAGLRADVSQLTGELQASLAERERTSNQLAELLPERDALNASLREVVAERDRLAASVKDLTAQADKVSRDLEDANKTIQADREKIELKLREIASLDRDLTALRKVREELEKKVTTMAAKLQQNESELTAVRDRSKALQSRLSTAEERTALAQKEIGEKDVRLRQLLARATASDKSLKEEKALSLDARRRVDLLNRQVAALREQLARLAKALEVSDAKSKEQSVQIADLGRRLNRALASKVEELARYRSEFFGQLRKVLGDRGDIRVVGDRFVFQSEVLFPSGSATLASSGRQQIKSLANTLKDISRKIPTKLDWVLRIDGHTDSIPINTPQFPSNWELSTGRAISVVKHLVELGIPANRLAATGFGEFQPLDSRRDEIAFRRNRRIEFKLTQR